MTPIDPTPLSDPELDAQIDTLEEKKLTINNQLASAKATFQLNGIRPDPQWKYNAKTALLHTKQLFKKLTAEKHARNRKNRSTKNFNHYFYQAAKKHLPPDQFQLINDEAKSLKQPTTPQS